MTQTTSAALPQAADPVRPRWYQFPVKTQLPQVPWLWAGLMQASWFVGLYIEFCSTTTMTFTLKKFIDHPMLITLVASLNTAYNMLVGATCNYMSDKVWTRIGRRKPFLIFSMAASATFLILIPFVNSFWLLLAMLVLYEAARDVGSPQEALINEVIPPHQRGRAGIFRTFMQQGATFFFFTIMIGQFDEKYRLADRFTITGEAMVYFAGAALALAMGLFYLFAVREQTPADRLPQPAPASPAAPVVPLTYGTHRRRGMVAFLRQFAHDAFADRQMRMVYLLMFAAQGTWIGLGSLAPLLFTEQFGYDKATYGKIVGYGTPAILIIAPIAGILVDRCNRLRLFIWGSAILIAQNIGYYIYCRYFAPNGVPPMAFLIIYPLCFAIVGQTASLAAITTVFDYIPSGRLGTFGSGWGILSAITTLVISNGLALWVTTATHLYPREGVKFDYLSGYIYLILLGTVFLACAMYFAHDEKKGNLKKLGVMEREGAARDQ